MTAIVKLKQDGVQVYPQTHTGAIENLEDYISEKLSELPGSGSGEGTVIEEATQTKSGLMSAADKKKLDNLPNITFEKVGEINE